MEELQKQLVMPGGLVRVVVACSERLVVDQKLWHLLHTMTGRNQRAFIIATTDKTTKLIFLFIIFCCCCC